MVQLAWARHRALVTLAAEKLAGSTLILLSGMHAACERQPKMTFCCLRHRRHRLSKRVPDCAVFFVPSACKTMAVHQVCQCRATAGHEPPVLGPSAYQICK